MINLSIVIPCYNESGSLPGLFESCRNACQHMNDIQFVFVNNGSNDDTQIMMNQLLKQLDHPFSKSVQVPINQGYGFGILQGLAQADGQILAWTHADLQTDPLDVILAYERYRDELNANTCLVKGERIGRNFFDNVFTAGMSLISSLLLRVKLWDINAQPKIFHRDFMENMKYAPNDFSLDLYLLYIASKNKLKINSFQVIFSKREYGTAKGGGTLKGKYKLIKRTLKYILELRQDIINGNRKWK